MSESTQIANILIPILSKELDKLKKSKPVNPKLEAFLKAAEEIDDKASVERAKALIAEEQKSVLVDFATGIIHASKEIGITLYVSKPDTASQATAPGKSKRGRPAGAKVELSEAQIKMGEDKLPEILDTLEIENSNHKTAMGAADIRDELKIDGISKEMIQAGIDKGIRLGLVKKRDGKHRGTPLYFKTKYATGNSRDAIKRSEEVKAKEAGK